MTSPHIWRAPHQDARSLSNAPNAALLIDFDNVTMGIRSDLGKELKTLLNSDVIRGKVAVQRAYADWRRYPSYIVPLAESSIDLIFAPAYGSSKKNATDLRMAVDAMELVFTRPEIGTFILLTGDSDFSSCVLKLKEYGKYVIGVGMRESSSDLLIQNCDEYYSYHALSGLTRAGDDEGVRDDPWNLVQRAVAQMIANGDAMRSDRLKQVMLGLDTHFDEKKLGYSKFSRFVSEAQGKGLLRLKKMEDGQYEIVPGAAEDGASAPERGVESSRERSRGRSRRGREAPRPIAARTESEPAEVAPQETIAEVAPEPQPVAEAESVPVPVVPAGAASDLQSAYALLQQAVRALTDRNGSTARDAEVKRKMLDLVPGFDEGALGFSKFTRFLRQAHEEEVVDLKQMEEGNYQVSLSPGGRRLPAPRPAASSEPATTSAPAAPVRGRGRGRRGGRVAAEGPPPLLPGQVIPVSAVVEEVEASEPEPAAPEPNETPTVPTEVEIPSRSPTSPTVGRGRRGGRGRGAAEGPPPILPGQVVTVPTLPAVPAETAEEAPSAAEAAPRRRGRGRARPAASEAALAVAAESTAFSAADLGLPRDAAAIQAYLTNSYKGVGKKTAETLVEALGDDLFQALQENPVRVREVLGDRRADALLEQWSADYARRAENTTPEPTEASAPSEDVGGEEGGDDQAPARGRSRGRRGGRGRGRSPKEPTPSA